MLTMWWSLLYTLFEARPCKPASQLQKLRYAAELHSEASVRPPDTAGLHAQGLGVCQAWGLPAGGGPTLLGHLGYIFCCWLTILGSRFLSLSAMDRSQAATAVCWC